MTRDRVRRLWLTCAIVLTVAAASNAQNPPVKMDRGQNIVPVFEGWMANPDGTFSMVFGYFNRNYREEIPVPVGAENRFEPGNPDRGQPTYFAPRRERFVFKVVVPADWGKKDLVWTLTSHGVTEKAYATLNPQLELIARNVDTMGNFSGDDGVSESEVGRNKAPSLTITPPQNVVVGTPISLVVQVADDGLPPPRPVSRNAPAGVPLPITGLRVMWLQYGGPAKVSLAAAVTAVTNGQATQTITFPMAGVYKLRVMATDGQLYTPQVVSMSVAAGRPQ